MYVPSLGNQIRTKVKNITWQRAAPGKTARVVTIAITIISALCVWAATTQARTCCGGIEIGSITYVGKATQVKDGQVYQYVVVLTNSTVDVAISNNGGQINIMKDQSISEAIVRLDQVEVQDADKNGSDPYEVQVSPVCDDLKISAPDIFPSAQWDCAERVDAAGNIIESETILLKKTTAKVTQTLCLGPVNDPCNPNKLGASSTETLSCTLPSGFSFDDLVIIKGDDNRERIFCRSCPSPEAPVEIDCKKVTR